MNPRYRLVVFDFDGTLADSADWFLSILKQLAVRHGFRIIADDEVDALRQKSNREIVRHLGVKPWRLPGLARDMRRLSAEAAQGLQLFEGIAGLIEELSATGIQIAIVSSNTETTVRQVLSGSSKHITHYACGATLFGKARHLTRLRRTLGLEGQDMISVGDEVRDIEAARSSGIKSAAVTWGYAGRQALADAQPDFLLESVGELRRVLLPALQPSRDARPSPYIQSLRL